MRKHAIYCLFLLCFFTFFKGYSQAKSPDATTTWVLTYIKSTHLPKEKLKEFLEKNWFVMDSIAVQQGLFKKYELIENLADPKKPSTDWDFIVAVEYFTPGTYDDIAASFEAIRKKHITIPVEGWVFKDLGKIVRSETVQKKEY